VPDAPTISDRDILERLRTRFGVDADSVEFLPIGYDAEAWVYRVHTRDRDLFLKIRRGPLNAAGLAISQLLSARGIGHLLAPIATVSGERFDAGDPAFILFPMIAGGSGGELGMTPAQWVELGATMRAIHDQFVDDAVRQLLRSEDFAPAKIDMVRTVTASIGVDVHADDRLRRELNDLWRSKRDVIDRLVGATEALAPEARDRAAPLVICHADIHAWNVQVTPDGDIVIVDWDSAMLAPRERDLMFVDGVAGGHEADPQAFFRGYGDVEVDPKVMAYYRVEWAVQDLAEFSARVLLDPDAGEETRAESMEFVRSMLGPGGQVEASLSALTG
jgi:spectinomycin phosphotransferase